MNRGRGKTVVVVLALAMLLVLLSLAVLTDPLDWLARPDKETIQGRWQLVTVLDGGKSPRELGACVFEEQTITMDINGRSEAVTYVLDKSQGWFDVSADGKTLLGIYRMEGDTLTVCVNEEPQGERPNALECELGSPNILMVMKR